MGERRRGDRLVKYRKRLATFDAWPVADILDAADGAVPPLVMEALFGGALRAEGRTIVIVKPEGDDTAKDGEYLMLHSNGEWTAYPSDLFHQFYEEVPS